MPTAVEDVLELSPPASKILADTEVRYHGMDAFPYEDRSPESHWRLSRTGAMWSRRHAPDTR